MTVSLPLLVGLVTNPLVDQPLIHAAARTERDKAVPQDVEAPEHCPLRPGKCAPQVIVCLGGFAWEVAFRSLAALGVPTPRPRPRFGHAAMLELGSWTLLGCYHPSQQNTFTGRLTEEMIDSVFAQARELVDAVA